MADIGDIVDVTIDNQTAAITAAGFGLPLFLGLNKGFTSRYKEYGNLTEVGGDFATTSDEYKAATAFFGQSTSVRKIAIGRRNSTIVTYTPVVADSATYSVTINGVLFSFISDASATATEIVTGLSAAINAGAEPVTASGTTTLILTADVVGVAFSAKATNNLTPVFSTTETFTEALDAIKLESNDWYGVVSHSHVKADVLEVASWVQANEKLFITSSTDTNIVNQTANADTTSTATALAAASYSRTSILYSADAAKFPEAAWMGGEFARDAGEATWMFKELIGITVDNLTSGQIANAKSKNANVYVPRGGQNMTQEGKTSSGTYIDIIRDTDYFKSQIQVAVFSRFINLPKIPYTDIGTSIIEAELRAVTQQAVRDTILADSPAPVIFIPKVADVAINDRANRILPDITITARIAGAIHYADIAVKIVI
jgi:hypothetical protein